MRLKIWLTGFLVLTFLVTTQDQLFAATCFCKVTANGKEVAKPTKGGFVQGPQKESCKNYCRGVWDSKSNDQLLEWAKLQGQCGNVSLVMEAAIGTAKYEKVRETIINVPCPPGPSSPCKCPAGAEYDANGPGNNKCKRPAGCTLTGAPNTSIADWGFVWGGAVYKWEACIPCTWTGWFDLDNPGGNGDYETIQAIVNSGQGCAQPQQIQCQTLSGQDWSTTGQVYTCTTSQGGFCVNANQPQGAACLDYRVRLCC